MSLMMSKGLEGLVDLDNKSGKGTTAKGIKATLGFRDETEVSALFVGFGVDNAAATKNIVLGVDSSTFKHIYCGSSLEYFSAFDNKIDLNEKILNFSIDKNNDSKGYFATLILEIEL